MTGGEATEAAEIDEAMIARLVDAFYTAARRDPVIGPVFATKITDWDHHLRRMCAFWSSVTLGSGRYTGSPMQAHAPLPIMDDHFARWLDLWIETVRRECPPQAAARFTLFARRIAQSLSHGIEAYRGRLPQARDAGAAGPPVATPPSRPSRI